MKIFVLGIFSLANSLPISTEKLTSENYVKRVDELQKELQTFFWFDGDHKFWENDRIKLDGTLDDLESYMIEQLDKNGDNLISIEEFTDAMENTKSALRILSGQAYSIQIHYGLTDRVTFNWTNLDRTFEFLIDIFGQYDKDGDESMDKEELKYGDYTTIRYFTSKIMKEVDRNSRGLDGEDRIRAAKYIMEEIITPLGKVLFGIDPKPIIQHMDWTVFQNFQLNVDTNLDGVWSVAECTAALINLINMDRKPMPVLHDRL